MSYHLRNLPGDLLRYDSAGRLYESSSLVYFGRSSVGEPYASKGFIAVVVDHQTSYDTELMTDGDKTALIQPQVIGGSRNVGRVGGLSEDIDKVR